MKKASDIINLLQNKPQFSKLSSYACIRKIESAFSKPLQKMIKFAYIKHQTLFFVLNHPGAKQEFDNNIDSIKSALKFATPKECCETPIDDIKAFVTHTPTHNTPYKPKEVQHYTERAKGDFSLEMIHDPKLKEIAKTIQKIIQHNHETRNNH